ncbi:MAG: DUF1002 domain-containing protein [Lachnospiraceae bacterium]|nr:DUF1002 domain-containing protein [Lachnospiraceae bacterium]
MKRLTGLFLTMTLAVAMTISAGATQAITFDDSGKGTVTQKEEKKEEEKKEEEKKEESKKSDEGGISAIIDSIFGGDNKEDSASGKADKKGYIALGADLTADQKTAVLASMGVPEAELSDYDIVTTTNAEEHAALDKYIASSVIGTKSLSSVLVKPAESGHGVVVTTNNINYCTTNMYRNALITAGVTDADIYVCAPSPISGTAALIGALKAYENMSGKEMSTAALDTSLNELVTTGQIKEELGNDDKAEELIAYIKTVVATNDLNTKEEIEAAIRKGMVDQNVTLSEDEIKQIVDMMMKIKAMGIDYKVLAEQADDIYAKYKDDIKAGTFDINKVDINDLGLTKIVGNAITSTAKSIGNSIASFFTSLFK